jgi:hypothetical protein
MSETWILPGVLTQKFKTSGLDDITMPALSVTREELMSKDAVRNTTR